MKKIITASLLTLSIFTLVNCSPKTAKKAATTTAPARTEVAKEAPAEKKPAVDPAAINSDVDGINRMNSLTADQQLAIYKDMAPLRADMGKKICLTQCNKCHDGPVPGSRTAESWLKVMKSMGPKAKLNTDQYLMTTAYLVQNAKK
jgi:cytochrome c5